MSDPVPLIRQPRKTIQRSVVSHVNSIYCAQESARAYVVDLEAQCWRAYVHVAFGTVIHARHAVVHVAVIHMRVIHV